MSPFLFSVELREGPAGAPHLWTGVIKKGGRKESNAHGSSGHAGHGEHLFNTAHPLFIDDMTEHGVRVESRTARTALRSDKHKRWTAVTVGRVGTIIRLFPSVDRNVEFELLTGSLRRWCDDVCVIRHGQNSQAKEKTNHERQLDAG